MTRRSGGEQRIRFLKKKGKEKKFQNAVRHASDTCTLSQRHLYYLESPRASVKFIKIEKVRTLRLILFNMIPLGAYKYSHTTREKCIYRSSSLSVDGQ